MADDQVIVFEAKKRTEDFGSAGSRRIVRNGGIPCVIYGKREPFSVIISAKDFQSKRRFISWSTLVEVRIDGVDTLCLIKDIQESFMNDRVQHIDFYEVTRGVPLTAEVEIVLTGTPIGVRDGGVLDQVTKDVLVECLPQDLPKFIKHDISSMQANTSIALSDIECPKNTRFVTPLTQTIATIKFTKQD